MTKLHRLRPMKHYIMEDWAQAELARVFNVSERTAARGRTKMTSVMFAHPTNEQPARPEAFSGATAGSVLAVAPSGTNPPVVGHGSWHPSHRYCPATVGSHERQLATSRQNLDLTGCGRLVSSAATGGGGQKTSDSALRALLYEHKHGLPAVA